MIEFDLTTFLFAILNLLILYFILKKILFKPVTALIEKRTNKIQEAIDSAAETKATIEAMKEEYDIKLKKAGEEGKKIINEYMEKANKEYEEIIERAKNDAVKIIKEAREEIATEKKQTLIELKGEISNLVLLAGEKVIGKNLDNKDNRKIIDDFIKDESVA